uniref:Zinc/iron permease n=1 Tax=Pseudo-nitzschia australis TaxID=44445 RepID=A0A7S4AUG0_9STRA|mmetsp:Transcript_26296/g.55151  ORF Transcript_26296/g.55151 Transcript_26296/m.55151 type:complete len:410 (-) Transcript_26296:407-1636(-)
MLDYTNNDDVKHKAIIAVATFLVAFLSAVAPLKIINVDEHLFSAGNLMASGVLLSAGLVHQLPDSIENLRSCSLSKLFPLAPFITGLTFCLFLVLEEYIHMHFNDHPLVAASNNDKESTRSSTSTSTSTSTSSIKNNSNNHNHHDHNHNQEHHHSNNHRHDYQHHRHFREDDALLVRRHGELSEKNLSLSRSSSCCSYDMESSAPSVGCAAPLESFRSKTFGQEHHHHHNLDHVAEHVHGSLLASVILLFALSIHSIFDGLAIGVSSTTKEVISVTTAVLAHKGFAGYALGSSMVAAEMNDRHYFVLVTVFSSCSVIGIVLGTVFEWLLAATIEDPAGNGGSVVMGVIKAIVAGTFLYISIVEIGLKEILICRESKLLGNAIGQNQMQWSKLAAFLFGYLAMSSLAVLV